MNDLHTLCIKVSSREKSVKIALMLQRCLTTKVTKQTNKVGTFLEILENQPEMEIILLKVIIFI